MVTNVEHTIANSIDAFAQIKRKKVLLIGDVLLDRYTFGAAKRISPEAPVPVLHVSHEEVRLGGAGNVACNLQALNQEVIFLSRIGNDPSGRELKIACEKAGISSEFLIEDPSFKTPTKVRLIASSQQMVRIDYENSFSPPAQILSKLKALVPELIEQADIVALSDYGKGFLDDELLQVIIDCASKKGIPVITDPKGSQFERYSGTTILKPNLQEANTASGLQAPYSLDAVALALHKRVKMDCLMVTRSDEGISLYFRNGKNLHFPVAKKDVRDVTGAGDTVLAVLVAGMASGLDLSTIVPLCNTAASIAIERVGCAVISWEDIALRLFESMQHKKVLKKSDLPLLKYAFENKHVSLVEISSRDVEALTLLRVIHQVSKAEDHAIIAHFVDADCPSELIETAAAIQSVQAVLMDCISPHDAENTLNVIQKTNL